MSLSGNASVATLLNADWLSSRVCFRKVEIFQLEQHLSRRKKRERARVRVQICERARVQI
jgi:hypothetical protein